MRVALFAETFLPKWDGVTNTTCRLLDHLAHHGHESIMFAPEGAPERYANTSIVGVRSFTCPVYDDLKLATLRADIGKEMDAFGPDVVHLVSPALLGLVGMFRAKRLGIPIVASYHTDVPGYMEKYGLGVLTQPSWVYFRMLHNAADLNVCPSSFTRKELREHGFQRVEIWGRGVDTTRFAPEHASEEWRYILTDGHPEAPLLVYSGRLAPEKRIDVLRPLLDMQPDVRLAILGDGPLRGELETVFRHTNTVFAGYLEGDALAAAYASGDVFVFPGEHETFGNVVLEAMASGLPVVAARRGGPVDHVFDGDNGFLFEPGRSCELSARVGQILGDPWFRNHLHRGALRYARSQTWESVMNGLIEKYQAVIGQAAADRRPLVSPVPAYPAM